jgi:hypothetical protein
MPRKRTLDTDVSVSRGAAAAPRRQTAAKPRVKRAENPVETVAVSAPQSDISASPVAAVSPAAGASAADIALLAYSFWESRGCQGGSPEEDWLRAEQQLSARVSAASV